MGEWVVSGNAGDVLVSIGLGSCIGLALIDPVSGVAGLAHVMLPDAPERHNRAGGEAKFADRAVPLLVDRLRRAGADPSRTQAVLVGGAKMFTLSGGSGLDIGARNEQAVLDALAKERVKVYAAETGGTTGRTIRVHVGEGRVTSKSAGGREVVLLGGAT